MAIGRSCAGSHSAAHRLHDRNGVPSGRSPFESLRVSGFSPTWETRKIVAHPRRFASTQSPCNAPASL